MIFLLFKEIKTFQLINFIVTVICEFYYLKVSRAATELLLHTYGFNVFDEL